MSGGSWILKEWKMPEDGTNPGQSWTEGWTKGQPADGPTERKVQLARKARQCNPERPGIRTPRAKRMRSRRITRRSAWAVANPDPAGATPTPAFNRSTCTGAIRSRRVWTFAGGGSSLLRGVLRLGASHRARPVKGRSIRYWRV